MVNRPSGRFGDHRGQPNGPSFRDKDTMRTSALRRPKNSAEVVWVFDAVQDHQQRRLLPLDRTIQNLFLSLIGFSRSKGHDTLMLAIGNETIEGGEGLNMNGNPARSG